MVEPKSCVVDQVVACGIDVVLWWRRRVLAVERGVFGWSYLVLWWGKVVSRWRAVFCGGVKELFPTLEFASKGGVRMSRL